jgi:hypothetical protein
VRSWDQAGLPEDFIQLDYRESRDLAKAPRESRFA